MKAIVQKSLWFILHPAWVITAILLVSLVVIAPLVNYVVPDSWYNWLASPLGSLVLSALIYLLALAVILIPITLYKRLGIKDILNITALRVHPQLRMVPWSLLAWGLYFGVTLTVALLLSYAQIPGLDLSQRQQIGFSNLHYGYEFVAAFLALVVLAPIFEEMIFRGYLYGRLRRLGGPLLSALITSIAFAAAHLQLNVAIDVFILSLFLCFLREKFDSIWSGVFVHALKNSLAYMILFILPLYGINLIQ